MNGQHALRFMFVALQHRSGVLGLLLLWLHQCESRVSVLRTLEPVFIVLISFIE